MVVSNFAKCNLFTQNIFRVSVLSFFRLLWRNTEGTMLWADLDMAVLFPAWLYADVIDVVKYMAEVRLTSSRSYSHS